MLRRRAARLLPQPPTAAWKLRLLRRRYRSASTVPVGREAAGRRESNRIPDAVASLPEHRDGRRQPVRKQASRLVVACLRLAGAGQSLGKPFGPLPAKTHSLLRHGTFARIEPALVSRWIGIHRRARSRVGLGSVKDGFRPGFSSARAEPRISAGA
jgi:hypothetical protein